MTKDDKTTKPTSQEVRAALAYFRSTTNRHDLVALLALALGEDAEAGKDDADVEHPAEPSVTQNQPAEQPKGKPEKEPANTPLSDRMKLKR